ncbi:hypothetical protein SAMN05216487_3272 [Pseudomonas sp. UC 17F4]|uniref:hypothetical protein n=1 Tax=Pseudomonas sp. UC 17F4 TaxID=1855328 RepID=UPI000889E4D7|nr:hypothetical protein [Pseudomonas sp. UC 17F4]SDQ68574.1 hypothetical protein SAMN05216487_3272 [Pseudomonas sp. UC 17F4]
MGLREEIQADMAEAFDTDLADAVQLFTGGITLPGTWDPVTETGGDPVVISYSGRGVFDAFKIALIDGMNIKATDQLLIALTNETTGVPQVGHKINGFDVINVQTDPAGAHYEIQLREV